MPVAFLKRQFAGADIDLDAEPPVAGQHLRAGDYRLAAVLNEALFADSTVMGIRSSVDVNSSARLER